MFSHFTLGSNDLARAKTFYAALMPVLNQSYVEIPNVNEHELLMFAHADQRYPHLFICKPYDDLPATWSNGYHIAFNAIDTAAVDRFHAIALANGGHDEGAPGLRSHYATDYYAAYIRDPDGNKLQAVCYTNGRRTGATGDTVSHITIGAGNLDIERGFYAAIFEALDFVELEEEKAHQIAAFGIAGHELPTVYLQRPFNGLPATWGNGTHTAFAARSKQAVNRFHALAIANGGTSEGEPGLRPQYSEHYYAAYVRDTVGNKLQAVYRGSDG